MNNFKKYKSLIIVISLTKIKTYIFVWCMFEIKSIIQ